VTDARAYVRVSTSRQEQGASLDTQRSAIAAYATAHGLTLLHEYVDILSGTRDDRPRYRQLLADMVTGDTILTWRLDRIGRNKSELFRFFEECKRRRIALVSVTQPELSNELVRDIMSVLAAYESQQLAERVKPNMAARVEQGKWVSRPPRWYVIGPNGRLVPAPDAADAQRVWEMVLATGSIETTAAAFGINAISLRATLAKRVYRGETVWSGMVIPNTHPAIVTAAAWDAVDALRQTRRRDGRRDRHDTALLTGYIYVATSEQRMYHYQRTMRGTTRRYYTTVTGHHTPRHSIRAEDAEAATVEALLTLTLTPARRRDVEREVRAQAKSDPYKRERAALLRKLAALDQEAVATARMEAQGRVSGAVAEGMRAAQTREHTRHTAALHALPPVPDLHALAPVFALRTGLDRLIARAWEERNIVALRILVETFIARVEVYGGLATRQQWRQTGREVRIKWNQNVQN